jgi:hypothetical protein
MCDPEMLNKLENLKPNEKNAINPEWEKLKDLYN